MQEDSLRSKTGMSMAYSEKDAEKILGRQENLKFKTMAAYKLTNKRDF